MKFPAGIEVSGIKKIVIDHKFCWELQSKTYYPPRDWELFIEGRASRSLNIHRKTPKEMTRYIRSLLSRKDHRAWVHGDTLNIVRRDQA